MYVCMALARTYGHAHDASTHITIEHVTFAHVGGMCTYISACMGMGMALQHMYGDGASRQCVCRGVYMV